MGQRWRRRSRVIEGSGPYGADVLDRGEDAPLSGTRRTLFRVTLLSIVVLGTVLVLVTALQR
jgi:hypothetical protein